MKRPILIGLTVAVAIIIGVAAALLWNAHNSTRGLQTFTGTIECLPKPGDGPHTLECALGLKASNKHYALKNNPQNSLPVGTNVKVSGTTTPPAANEIYDITATIDVKTIETIQ
jgi:hypothetical protein